MQEMVTFDFGLNFAGLFEGATSQFAQFAQVSLLSKNVSKYMKFTYQP